MIDDGFVKVSDLLSGLAQVDVDIVSEQVFNRVLRFADKRANQRGVAQIIALLHVLVEPVRLVGAEVVAIAFMLERGADGEHALRGIAHAAEGRAGFHTDDLRAVLSGGEGSSRAGSTHADDQHVAIDGFVLTLDDLSLLEGHARFRERGSGGFDDGVGGQGRAGHGIHIRRLGVNDCLSQFGHGGAAQSGRFGDAGGFNGGNLAVLNGHVDGYVAAKSLGGSRVGLGGSHRRAKNHGTSKHTAEQRLHAFHEKIPLFLFHAGRFPCVCE